MGLKNLNNMIILILTCFIQGCPYQKVLVWYGPKKQKKQPYDAENRD
jgi:hypothetical protein